MAKLKVGEDQYKGRQNFIPEYVKYLVDKWGTEIQGELDDHVADYEAHVAGTADRHKAADVTFSGAQANVQDAIDSKADKTALAAHEANNQNPHGVTKTQVGLGSVDNVKQAAKTEFDAHDGDSVRHIAQPEREAWNAKADQTALDAHMADQSNPHGVTKAQVGLGNADNTADLDKPVSTAMQAALDTKVDQEPGKGLSANDYTDADKAKLAGIEAGAQVNTVTSVAGKTGAVVLSKEDVGLGQVDNVQQASKAELEAHKADTGNPHGVTKAQVGLGNVDNTADMDKPVSTAVQAALDALEGMLASLSGVFTIKGQVDTAEGLPSEGNTEGDVWLVGAVDAGNAQVYVWVSPGQWLDIGLTVQTDLRDYYTKDEVDQLLDMADGLNMVIGNTEPEAGPCLWFNTGFCPPEQAALKLGEVTADTPVVAEMDGRQYGVENASVDGTPALRTYDFRIY